MSYDICIMKEVTYRNLEIKDELIRQLFDETSQKWYFSIVDIIAIVADTKDPRNYWKVLKNRLKKGQNKLVTECNQLKMKASDGKFYLTDAGTIGTILNIIEIIAPENLDKFEDYFKKFKNLHPAKASEISTAHNENRQFDENILPIDSYEKDGFLIIKTFVAGVSIENISLSSDYEKIEIKGKRLGDKNSGKKDYINEELIWGNFSRTFDLPFMIDINETSSELERGLLTIKLKKLDREKKKEIRIKSL